MKQTFTVRVADTLVVELLRLDLLEGGLPRGCRVRSVRYDAHEGHVVLVFERGEDDRHSLIADNVQLTPRYAETRLVLPEHGIAAGLLR